MYLQVFSACLFILSRQGAAGLPDNRGARLLFKHSLPQEQRGPTFHADLHRDFVQSLSVRRRLLGSLGQDVAHQLQFSALDSQTGLDMLEVPAGLVKQWVLQALQQHPGIEFVEEDKALSAYSSVDSIVEAPDDPRLSEQWAMYQLGLFSGGVLQGTSLQGSNSSRHEVAWQRSIGADNITVAIIDSGLDYTHPDLQGNIWVNQNEIPNNGLDDDGNGFVDDYYGYNFLNNTGNVKDDNFHGTHLAGIVGAVCNNSIGVCGVSQQVKVMACKFLDSNGNGYTSDAIRCMSYALQMGAHITLNSYGGVGANSQSLQAAVANAEKAGQLFVTAAGNDYGANIDTVPVYPAAYKNANVMPVIAIDQNDKLANYSNFGPTSADIAAPGSHIISTIINGDYGYHDGTSQSAAFVAGAAALLLAAYQQAGFNVTGFGVTVKKTIMDGAAFPDSSLANCSVSGGTLDVGKAMSLVPRSSSATSSAPTGGQPLQKGKEVVASQSSTNTTRALSLAVASPPSQGLTAAAFGTALTHSFKGPFGLQNSSLSFIKEGQGWYSVCKQGDLRDLPNKAAYGLDITRQLLADANVLVDLPEEIPLGDEAVWRVAILADGTLQLLASPTNRTGLINPSPVASPSPDPILSAAAAAQPVALHIAALGADLRLDQGGQVSYFQRPDRLVVSFIDIHSANGTSSFQAEIFLKPGRLPPGSVRLTWLQIAAQPAVVGIAREEALLKAMPGTLLVEEVCLLPPTLRILPEEFPPLVLEGTNATVDLRLDLANLGNATLGASIEVRPRGENLLQPSLWLNQATEYLRTYEASNLTCQQYAPLQDPVCVNFSISGGSVSMQGAYLPKPMRLAQKLSLPLRVQALIERSQQCSNQYLVLSDSPVAPSYYGAPGSLWLLVQCSQKYIFSGTDSVQSSSCVDFGMNSLDIRVDLGMVQFSDDYCTSLSLQHSLGAGPLYLFIGALCNYLNCPDGAVWSRLEVLDGPGSGPWTTAAPPPVQPINSTATAFDASSTGETALPMITSKEPLAASVLLSASGTGMSAVSAEAGASPSIRVESASVGSAPAPGGRDDAASLLQAVAATDGGSPAAACEGCQHRLMVQRSGNVTQQEVLQDLEKVAVLLQNSSGLVEEDLASLLNQVLGKAASPRLGVVSSQSSRDPGPAPAASLAGGQEVWVTPSWVEASTDRIEIAQGQGASTVQFRLSGIGAEPGTSLASVVIRSNDPDMPVARLALNLSVA